MHNVVDVSAAELHAYDVLLIGASTWDTGELQYDWANRLPELAEFDWRSEADRKRGRRTAMTFRTPADR